MDATLKKIELLVDEVSNLKTEVIRNRLEVDTLEKEVKRNQKKIADLEKKQAPSSVHQCNCQSDINDTKELKLKVAAFEKEFRQFGGVKSKCASLSKLQVLLSSALVKCQNSVQLESQIVELQKDHANLSRDVTAWQYALVDHQQLQLQLSKLTQDVDDIKDEKKKEAAVQSAKTKQEHYYSSLCNNNTAVFHDRGIVKYDQIDSSKDWGTFISAQPLNSECTSFSINILRTVSTGYIGIRVEYFDGTNWHRIAGYYSDGDIIDEEGDLLKKGPKCKVGDTMKCSLDIKARNVMFYKNGLHVGAVPCKQKSDVLSLHPAILLKGIDKAVQMLEEDPWRQ